MTILVIVILAGTLIAVLIKHVQTRGALHFLATAQLERPTLACLESLQGVKANIEAGHAKLAAGPAAFHAPLLLIQAMGCHLELATLILLTRAAPAPFASRDLTDENIRRVTADTSRCVNEAMDAAEQAIAAHKLDDGLYRATKRMWLIVTAAILSYDQRRLEKTVADCNREWTATRDRVCDSIELALAD